MSKVDIIIPVYKVENFIRRCLDSVLAQTYSDWRAICIDDGSPDGCPGILDGYAAADSRFLVIHKPNGGLSSARNAGLDIADAEFIMFIDSDDFIHPQTLEIGLYLAEREGSDIVSWYRDSSYRNHQVKLLRMLGKDDISAKPWRYGKRYRLDRIRTHTTWNLFGHCSDKNHPNIRWAVKHNHVFKLLLRRSKTGDLRFISGMTFEDIPWWSEMILRKLKTTITQLPLYYYYPNPKSILKAGRITESGMNILKGITICHRLYQTRGTEWQKEHWSHHFKWELLRGVSKNAMRIDDPDGCDKLRRCLSEMWDEGIFNDYNSFSSRKTYIRIARFIGRECDSRGLNHVLKLLV